MENPDSERVQEKMKENEELKEAVEKVNAMSDDEYMQRIAELREMAIIEENTAKSTGVREGIEQGLNQGRREEKMAIVKKMLKEKISIEIIAKVTELSIEEIKNVKL